MDRQHRRELKRDKFVDELGTLSSKARENQRFLLMITAGVIAIALIGYGIFFYRQNKEKEARVALASAIETIDSPLAPAPVPGAQPLPGAKYKTDAERSAAAEKQFKDVVAKYDGTDSADVAKLYLARLQAARGDSAGAKTLLQAFVSDHQKTVLGAGARYSLFELRIENGEAGQVVQEINAEMKKTDPVLPNDTLLALLAHAYDAQGDNKLSRDTYRRIATEYPDSPYAGEAQRRAGPAA